jgi:branched-chain amino acid transport system ATP-binding protein
MIDVNSVRAGYVPGIDVLNGISATFADDEISSIVGPNGAGKSTLIKTIYGFLDPHEGTITYDGEDLTQYGPEEMARAVGFAYIPQERSVFPDLTVHENLQLGAWPIRKQRERVERSLDTVYEEFPALREKQSDRAGTLSGGQQRMLEIGRSLVIDPNVVLIDEPSVGLAPRLAANVYDSVQQLAETGVTVILIDQNVRAAVEYGDALFVLEQGKVVAQGDSEEMNTEVEELISDWISTEAVTE